MHLRLIRHTIDNHAMLGTLLVDDEFQCYTLEDLPRPDGEKVFGETAIPFGSYDIKITYSPKFKRDLPLVLNVPGFDGIRIHPGTTEQDTHGCLLVGEAYVTEPRAKLQRSRLAFEALFARLKQASHITLSVEDGGDIRP